MNNEYMARLSEIANEVRFKIINSIYEAQTGHAGPSLSMVEILVFLYFKHLRIDPKHPNDPARDRFVLSKGHGAPGLYAILAQAGFFPPEILSKLRKNGHPLHGHPKAEALPGVDVSTGSLGQGLSIALGLALGMKRRRMPNRVFCLLGDGELQEGQNWEAMMAASGFQADNLIAIVDRNGLQNDGPTEKIVPLEDLVAKAEAFGWKALRINGHDFSELQRAFDETERRDGRPSFIVADTIKGKGIAYMEGVVKWHHNPIAKDEFESALMELGRNGK